jgi:hypothetical protein
MGLAFERRADAPYCLRAKEQEGYHGAKGSKLRVSHEEVAGSSPAAPTTISQGPYQSLLKGVPASRARASRMRWAISFGIPSSAQMLCMASCHVFGRVARCVLLRAAHSHFFSLHCLIPASATRSNSESNSWSGAVLKLKQVFPCIRFFNSGEMFFATSASGIR